MVELAKANNTELLNEVMSEWTTELKARDKYLDSEAFKLKLDPRRNEFSSQLNQAQFLSVYHKDQNGFGIFHAVASNASLDQFMILIANS